MSKFPFNSGFFKLVQSYTPVMSLMRNEKSILSDENVAINMM
jgi:hypothetical protein